ncbi:ABC transporter permease [Undibacterium sp. RTI2.1]|uniref:ABC transporter permease n=1 Tax=unclassified Undibacterium TaxID=2630295 RepID=UPI002AB4E1EA|nr:MULTISPECIES: FtsX-like permease family protein [unclassified Undibacterium]MDY7536718.1 FtsX-like permease family protein [Undibacterium sp. 5I1]MEB0032091.1 ABC transporter permease [Undibacterium sp. RTI2.1]MEB0118338.1 ABC transporter permease [Undibacterium sp. RTI2.2]MEB0230237.1 ABC transporter permease [Undibacterium sp. 10I3]MEB0257937.1 ABC transporter permease [Undibacterium sp. 5I1]
MEIRPILSALLRNKTAPLLVAIQVAISLAILTNAMYIVQLRQEASVRSSGINDEASVFHITSSRLQRKSMDDFKAVLQSEKQILRAIPGVVSVAQTSQVPMSRSGSRSSISVDRLQTLPSTTVDNYNTSDSLVKTLGLKLIAGRDFNPDDVLEYDPREQSDLRPRVVIVTKAVAKELYPNEANVIGKSMFWGTGNDSDESKIIGVVESLQTTEAESTGRFEDSVIAPLTTVRSSNTYFVRVEAGQRDRVMKEAESALTKAAGEPMIVRMDTIDNERFKRYRSDKALAWMLITVSALLMLVTASGIVGMSTLWVAQRRKQIGVRRALGARKVDILRYFITENILITTGGIVLGTMLAVGLNQLLVSQFELSKLPFQYLFFAPCVFWILGVAAVYVPALRGASISPATATRGA